MTFISSVRAILGLALAVAATVCAAGPYPDKPIKLIVGWPPGGATDNNARLIAVALSKRLGQPVVVDNRPGAGGMLGGAAVAGAPADGYTLAYIASSNVITSILLLKPSYGKGEDLEPVATTVSEPLVLLVGPGSKSKNVADLVTYAKANPGKLAFASTGNGGILHLAAAALIKENGLDATHVPYKGTSPALTDVMADRIDFFFGTFSDALPLVKAGKVRALAVTASARSPLIPEVPTLSEALSRDHAERGTWQGILVPRGTPAEVTTLLSAQIAEVMKQPEVIDSLRQRGASASYENPQAMNARIVEERRRRKDTIDALGIKSTD